MQIRDMKVSDETSLDHVPMRQAIPMNYPPILVGSGFLVIRLSPNPDLSMN